MAGMTKAQLEVALADAERRLERTETEFESLKTGVVEVALRVQRDEGWCDSGVAEALKELGLEVPSKNKTATVVMEVEVNINSDDVDSDYTGHADRLTESIEFVVDAISENLDVVEGWDGERYEFGDVSRICVTDVKDA